MQNDLEDRLARLEKKVDWILRLVAAQLVVTLMMAVSYGVSYLIQIASTIVVLLIVTVPLLYIFRHSLPGAARRAGKRVGKLVATIIWRKSPSS